MLKLAPCPPNPIAPMSATSLTMYVAVPVLFLVFC
jgi:hypothetical protein